MKLITTISLVFILFGCQTSAKQIGSFQTTTPSTPSSPDVFDVSLGEEMVQVDAKEISNGYMYTFTNNGISPSSSDLSKKVIVVEINGEKEPYRLKSIFPNYCSEISYADAVIDDYRTWTDILSCPYYDDSSSNKGLLVINKSIQGSDKLFGATLYKTIPKYAEKNIEDYRELPLSRVEIEDINRFIDETNIIKAQLATNNPSENKLGKVAALNLSARYLSVQQICKHKVSDIYLGSLQLISNIDTKSDWYSRTLKSQIEENKKRVRAKQEELSIEQGCEFYKSQINNDIEAHLSMLYSNKSTSDIQDKGLFEITRALQARDFCGYKTSVNATFNETHNLDTSDFSKDGAHLGMFFYHAIQAGLNMNRTGRSSWCEEVITSSKLLVPE